ncbi:hypothetical protein EVAR_59016_1 [Eumeta japonica]|uniref:Uncharacterized protein n=1 Tax=Eumeta variegata TaxID=151549 RepID=A0A4C1ZIR8_EUMVA|nr:hypothetical protein EVAR_59016_1 [Eumeta japonica]
MDRRPLIRLSTHPTAAVKATRVSEPLPPYLSLRLGVFHVVRSVRGAARVFGSTHARRAACASPVGIGLDLGGIINCRRCSRYRSHSRELRLSRASGPLVRPPRVSATVLRRPESENLFSIGSLTVETVMLFFDIESRPCRNGRRYVAALNDYDQPLAAPLPL